MAKKYKVKNGRFGDHDAGAKLTESEITEGGWKLDVLLARGVVVELDANNEEVAYEPTGEEERVIAVAEAEARTRAVNVAAGTVEAPEPTPAEKRAATIAAKKVDTE